MGLRRSVALFFVLPALLAAAPHAAAPHAAEPTRPPASPSPVASSATLELSPTVVLRRYADALAHASPPPALIFDYTVEQAGLRDIEQKHRVYRGKAVERDEMTEIDGRVLPAPMVRVISERTDRYDILALAPRPDQYALTFAKVQRNDGRVDYVFRAASRASAPFAVDSITIDGEEFLPSVVDFHTNGDAAQSSGQLLYGRVEGHWLIREASVSAVMSSKQVREHLLWTSYQFPSSLPASTFTPPRTGPGALAVMHAGK